MESIPLMEGIYAFCVGLLTASGVYLTLRGRTFTVVVGLTLLSYAVNLFLFASGRLRVNGAVILGESSQYADPLPQALVLTAIVIGFAMTAFIVILAIRARADMGNDQVDGRSHPDEEHGNQWSSGANRQSAPTSKASHQHRTKPAQASSAQATTSPGTGNKNTEGPAR